MNGNGNREHVPVSREQEREREQGTCSSFWRLLTRLVNILFYFEREREQGTCSRSRENGNGNREHREHVFPEHVPGKCSRPKWDYTTFPFYRPRILATADLWEMEVLAIQGLVRETGSGSSSQRPFCVAFHSPGPRRLKNSFTTAVHPTFQQPPKEPYALKF